MKVGIIDIDHAAQVELQLHGRKDNGAMLKHRFLRYILWHIIRMIIYL